MDWKEEISKIVKSGCTDSDIEDYLEAHPDISGKEVWDFVCELRAPEECKGCKHTQMSGTYPCNACHRGKKTKNFYEPNEGDTDKNSTETEEDELARIIESEGTFMGTDMIPILCAIVVIAVLAAILFI